MEAPPVPARSECRSAPSSPRASVQAAPVAIEGCAAPRTNLNLDADARRRQQDQEYQRLAQRHADEEAKSKKKTKGGAQRECACSVDAHALSLFLQSLLGSSLEGR